MQIEALCVMIERHSIHRQQSQLSCELADTV